MLRMLITLAAISSALLSVAAARAGDSATSPDGRYRVWVKVERPPAVDGLDRGITSLWLTDRRTGATRMVMRGDNRPSDGADFNAFWGPHFSMNGK